VTEPGPRRTSYAQNGEDVRAWRALRDVPDAFYVEVGASHPYDDSLTAALSAEGWRGLLVEPEPSSAELLRESRPRDVVIAAAAHSRPGMLTWNDLGTRGRGSIDVTDGVQRTVSVPAVRLTDLLDDVAPQAVHFMSIDVEGHEEQALLGLDLGRWRPWVLCVEATLPGSREMAHAAWEPQLLQSSYRFVAFDGLNRWYVAEEHADLAEAVAEPFGVLDRLLDGWQPRDVVELDGHLRRAQDRLAELETELETTLRVQRKESEEAVLAAEQRAADLARELVATQALAAERSAAATAADAAVQSLKHELHRTAVERAEALARESVMLQSKSWRLTSPLRATRKSAYGALVERRQSVPAVPAATAPEVVLTQADRRRSLALRAKVQAARRRRSP
jgi:FkbM family methyltransferase